MVSGHNDCMIRVHDPKAKSLSFKIEEAHADPVSCVRFTPDERFIVSTSKDDVIKVWDLRTQKLANSFEHELFKLGSTQSKFGISPNSQFVACGTIDGYIVFYELKEGKCVDINREAHKSQVIACDWQPKPDKKESRLATVDDLGGLYMWG